MRGEGVAHNARASCASLVHSPTLGTHHVHAVIERVFHHRHRLLHLRVLLSWCRSVREQGLVNLEQGPLVVDEEIQDVALVLAGEVADLDTVLGQLGQSE